MSNTEKTKEQSVKELLELVRPILADLPSDTKIESTSTTRGIFYDSRAMQIELANGDVLFFCLMEKLPK